MLKRWVVKMFGFDDEIHELRRQIRELSWDSSFGMWTRNAFLQFCHVMPRDVRWIAFLDMNKIHELNEQLVESAAEHGMTFYAELGQWEVGKITIEYTVEELAEKVAKQKREAAPPMN